MSFGFSISDVVTLVRLAYRTFDGAKRACGEHDELTKEMSSLVTVLDHVQSEISDPDSPINMARGHRRKELKSHIDGCLLHVQQMNTILTAFNGLSDMQRGGSGSLWQRVRFGNGPVKDIAQIRLKISTYTTAITISLTLLSLGSRGEAERQLSRQRGELKGITESINMIVARLNVTSYEGSIWTKCTDDDVGFWRDFRRQLVKKGYRSQVIRSHESLIQAYMRELDSRGVLNDETRHSQSSIDVESVAENSRLPELGADQVDVEVSTQNQGEVLKLGREEADISELSISQSGLLGGENTEDDARRTNLILSSHVDQPQGGESDRSQLSEPQSVIIDAASTINECCTQDIDTPLGRDTLAKVREAEFRALSSEERKVTITMQDPSGRKYSLPYFLVKTWDGMHYLIEQALQNIEEICPRVAKAEYDLINEDGAVIIPHLWEAFVEPDMLVTMQIWPVPSPQPSPTISTAKLSPPVRRPPPPRWTPPPSPPPPSRGPPCTYKPQSTAAARRHLALINTSQMSSQRESTQKANHKSSGWSWLWSSSPPKAKSTKSTKPRRSQPPPQWPYRSYVRTINCACSECQPIAPSSSASRIGEICPQGTPGVAEPESVTNAAAGYTRSVSTLKVEPILELEGAQIYELE